jgi:hypothetical protein
LNPKPVLSQAEGSAIENPKSKIGGGWCRIWVTSFPYIRLRCCFF